MDTELAQTQEKASSSLIRNSSCMETDGNSIWLQKNIFYQTSAIDTVTKEVFKIHIHTQGIPPSVLLNALPHFMLFRHWLSIILCIAAHI